MYTIENLPPQTELAGGRYRVLESVGRGGFGVSYRAFDSQRQQPVALKEHLPWGCRRSGLQVFRGDLSAQEFSDCLRRFQREVECLRSLCHPGIVGVRDAFEQNGTAYLCMDWVEGRPLQPGDRLECWLPQVAESLAYLHSQGLVHGDLKLSNMLLRDDGRIVLIDFGNCRPNLTRATTAIVSHGYSPPELYSTATFWGPASDIYALAACALEVLTGSAPPAAAERLAGQPLPPGLEPALTRALHLDPAGRFRDVDSFCQALLGESRPGGPPPHKGWIRALAACPRGKLLASGGEDRSLRVWDTTRSLSFKWGEAPGWVRALAFTAPDRLLVLAERHCSVWGPEGVQASLKLPAVGLSLIAQGGRAWVGDDHGWVHELTLDPLTYRRGFQACTGAVTGLDIQRQHLACAGGEERIPLWDLDSGQLLEKLKGHRAAVRCLQFANETLFSGGADQAVLEWDWAEGRQRRLGACSGTIWCLLNTPAGLVSGDGAKQVLAWNATGSRPLGRHQGEVRCLAYLDGQVFSAGQDGCILAWPCTSSLTR